VSSSGSSTEAGVTAAPAVSLSAKEFIAGSKDVLMTAKTGRVCFQQFSENKSVLFIEDRWLLAESSHSRTTSFGQ
jgi:hypothetical protein